MRKEPILDLLERARVAVLKELAQCRKAGGTRRHLEERAALLKRWRARVISHVDRVLASTGLEAEVRSLALGWLIEAQDAIALAEFPDNRTDEERGTC